MKTFILPLLFTIATASPAQEAGTWYLTSQPDLPSLMERATKRMKPAERARTLEDLKNAGAAFRQITIAHEGGQITIQYDQQKPLRMRDDAYATPCSGAGGKDCLSSAHMEGRNLVQTLLWGDGMRRTVFHANRGILTLQVTIKTMLLPKGFNYTLVYHSKEAVPATAVIGRGSPGSPFSKQ
jgi:hypothetical protein